MLPVLLKVSIRVFSTPPTSQTWRSGNAEVASEIVSATNFGDLESIIKGENAVFSRSNPGVPIAYTVRYLKDNSFAKLGYTTDYQIETCTQNQHPAREISVHNKNAALIGPIIKFTITYKQLTDGITYNRTIHSGNINLQNKVTRTVPAGSFDIKLTVEVLDGFSWKFVAERNWDRPTKACFETNSNLHLFQDYSMLKSGIKLSIPDSLMLNYW